MMTKERRGEIAYTLLKHHAKKERIRLDAVNRETGNLAKATGIGEKELTEFVATIVYSISRTKRSPNSRGNWYNAVNPRGEGKVGRNPLKG